MLSAILFFICAALAIAGALLAVLTPGARTRSLRALGLLAVTIGAAGLFALLSAGFAAVVELVAGAATALLVALAPGPSELLRTRPTWPAQIAATACTVLFALLAYAAWAGGLAAGAYPGGWVNTAAVGRLLLDRDALAGAALGGLLLTGIGGAAVARRARRR